MLDRHRPECHSRVGPAVFQTEEGPGWSTSPPVNATLDDTSSDIDINASLAQRPSSIPPPIHFNVNIPKALDLMIFLTWIFYLARRMFFIYFFLSIVISQYVIVWWWNKAALVQLPTALRAGSSDHNRGCDEPRPVWRLTMRRADSNARCICPSAFEWWCGALNEGRSPAHLNGDAAT